MGEMRDGVFLSHPKPASASHITVPLIKSSLHFHLWYNNATLMASCEPRYAPQGGARFVHCNATMKDVNIFHCCIFASSIFLWHISHIHISSLSGFQTFRLSHFLSFRLLDFHTFTFLVVVVVIKPRHIIFLHGRLYFWSTIFIIIMIASVWRDYQIVAVGGLWRYESQGVPAPGLGLGYKALQLQCNSV